MEKKKLFSLPMIIMTAISGGVGFLGSAIASGLAALGGIPVIGMLFKFLAFGLKMVSGIFRLGFFALLIAMLAKIIINFIKNRKAKKMQGVATQPTVVVQTPPVVQAPTSPQVSPAETNVNNMNSF